MIHTKNTQNSLNSSNSTDTLIKLEDILGIQGPDVDLYSDMLEAHYMKNVPYPHRKQMGQFFTPSPIADLMIDWVLRNRPTKLLDPACGTGIFERSIFKQTDEPIKITAYDLDEMMVGICKQLSSLMSTLTMEFIEKDYLLTPWEPKYDAIICNPPYLKHHHIRDKHKYISTFREKVGSNLSLNTNIYSLFMIKSLHQLTEKGRMAFITPSEFLNANYGVEVKRYLMNSRRWRYIVVFDFKIPIFNGAITTACINLFENSPSSDGLTFIKVKNEKGIGELKSLIADGAKKDFATSSVEVFSKPFRNLNPVIKWRQYFEKQHQSSLLVPFTKYASVTRGIATGANHYFTFNEEELEKFAIDRKYVVPCLTKAYYAPDNIFTESRFDALVSHNKKTHLLYVDGNIKNEHLTNYLHLGMAEGIHKRYLTSHRNPWWLTDKREPAPILVIVFGRQGLRFVRNETGVRNLTCFHSVYLTSLGKKFINVLMAFLITNTAQKILGAEKREYGNGLEKFEPNDLNKGLLIDFEVLPTDIVNEIESIYKLWRKTVIENLDGKRYKDKLDDIFGAQLNLFNRKSRKFVPQPKQLDLYSV